MVKYKFELKDAYEFGWEGLKAKAYSDASNFKEASVSVFYVTGSHGKVKSLVSNRIYYVLEGEGEFIINNEIIPVKITDVVIVPKNTPYDYKAKKGTTLKLFLVHSPSWNSDKEVKLK
jgi:mannose-6-phosphate isomerase-like protein (cupin superfamily)